MPIRTPRVTPLGAVARGLAAGVVGTAAMTAAQELSMRLPASEDDAEGGEQQDEQSEEGGQQSDPWDQASAPAKVARRFIEGVFQREVPADAIPALTHATHWGYGTGWGAVYGLVQGSMAGPALGSGLAFGTFVWGMAYVQMVPMGLYEPPWKYSPKALGTELGFHLAYGAALGAGYAAVDRHR